MTQPALAPTLDQPDTDWIEHVLADVQSRSPTLDAWSLSLWEGGVRVHLQVGATRLHLDLHERTGGRAYASTPSLSMFLRLEGGATLEPAVESVVKDFVKALDLADPGGRRLPKGDAIQMDDPADKQEAEEARLDQMLAWRDAHDEHAEQLHMFSFMALKALLSDDLYPHVMALGEDIPEAEIQQAWANVNTYMSEGRAPDKLGIYVHVPYCTVECSFCYCGKTEQFTRGDFDTYTEGLLDEMATYAPLVAGQKITSVYFGGGTPSLLTPPAMRAIFERLYGDFDVPEGTQVIFEGNPDSLKPHKVEILGTLGRVTRLTMGIQTLDPEVQKFVRRYNKKPDVEAAIRAAKQVGIPHVNFDCIAGLPGQSMQSWQNDIEYLLSLEPDSIHLNGFRPLPRTLYAQGGQSLDPALDRMRDEMLEWAEERLSQQGFGATLQQGPHKTRNAANLQEYDLRTQNSSLLGFGYPSRSHAFAGWYYIRDTSKGFVDSLREQNGSERRYSGIRADHDEEMHKYVVTNIRTGFDRREFRRLFGVDAVEALSDGFKTMEKLGVVEYQGDRVLFRTGSAIDALVYRAFFYSHTMARRALAKWGAEYDRNEDYRKHLAYLVPGAD